jgi:hypothetical protein
MFLGNGLNGVVSDFVPLIGLCDAFASASMSSPGSWPTRFF